MSSNLGYTYTLQLCAGFVGDALDINKGEFYNETESNIVVLDTSEPDFRKHICRKF